MKKIIIFISIIFIFLLVVSFWKQRKSTLIISSFEDCVQAGNPVMDSYPEQCRTSEGKLFVRDIGNELEKNDLIRINNPRPGQSIISPLEISGEARGHWFFEADFPIRIFDEDGKELGSAIATAESEWMTEDFVSFTSLLEFSLPNTKKGNLMLEKDNPSGLPEFDDYLRVPVVFEF